MHSFAPSWRTVIRIPDECETSETVSSTFVSCSLVPFVQVFIHGCLDFCFHAVQCDIGQEGGYHAPLWGSCLCRLESGFIDGSGFEPCLDASMDARGGVELL